MTQAEELKSLAGTQAQREAFLAEIGGVLPAAHRERIARILELIGWLLGVLEMKNLSIARLRQLCFGNRSESASQVLGKPPQARPRGSAKGHGRHSHRCYTGARRVRIAHPTLIAGQRCPQCQKGKLRPHKKPAIAIQVSAQPPVGAVIHEMEQLRCDACGRLFTAATPPEAGVEKYDPSVGVMAAIMRYGSGMPFYRLERLQQSLGVPLPSSVQWEQVLRAARELQPVFDHMIYLSAQSELVFNDDTTMKVSVLRKEIQAEEDPKRTGIFTTGIVSRAEHHPISLFFTGRAHAGENLADTLEQRQPQLPPPLHMHDGLPQNTPKGHSTVDCSCNVHARRNFVEIQGDFPEECSMVIESFSEIFRVEAQAAGLSPQERLEIHQARSQPVMDRLKAWFAEQMDGRKVEPNSALGKAIQYMKVRWTELTQFLRVPGAPLDNNAAERILKTAILHRKNSLFYRTQRGADVGDLFMSLVQTCRANAVNPFDYMLAVVKNAQAAKLAPQLWMPWNYPACPHQQPATNP